MFLLNMQRGCGLSECSFFTVAILNPTPNFHLVLSNCCLKVTLHVSFSPLLDSSVMCKIPGGTALVWDIIDVLGSSGQHA
jgi:hypothetical protein